MSKLTLFNCNFQLYYHGFDVFLNYELKPIYIFFLTIKKLKFLPKINQVIQNSKNIHMAFGNFARNFNLF